MRTVPATATTHTTDHPAWISASHAPALGSITVVLTIILTVTLGYALTCWLWPFKPCRTCSGTGKRYSPFSRRALRIHPRCNGTGLRRRTGRVLYEYLRTEHRNAHPRTTTRR